MSDDLNLDQSEIDNLLGGDDSGGGLSDDLSGGMDLGGGMDAGGGDLDLGGGGDLDLGGGMDLGGGAAPEAHGGEAPHAAAHHAEGGSVVVSNANMESLLDVPLEITVELGRSRLPIRDILDLGPGSVVELSRMADEPIHVLVNGKLVAKGEVVVVDENFGVKISNIISPAERLSQI